MGGNFMNIALMRLDGLGGTITLSDQVKKIKEDTDYNVTIIIRKYRDLFINNPHIDNIIEVNNQDWRECFSQYRYKYDIFCELRYIVARWYNQSFEPNYHDQLQFIYDNHMVYRTPRIISIFDTESLKLHQTQMVNLSLGLPYDSIDVKVFSDRSIGGLPKKYLVINNGIDEIHGKMKQTKMWYTKNWEKLVSNQHLPVVQVGTSNDEYIKGTIDLRGKTNILQLIYILKKSTAIICTEGGIMHLAYASGVDNVLVLQGPTAAYEFTYPGHKILRPYTCSGCWYSTPHWFYECPKQIDSICMKSITPERVTNTLSEML
jgi:ADP-heptose:LPS heptosyltransferase